jgi:hypothetical protein
LANVVCIVLGLTFYIAGLINQTFVFIDHNEMAKNGIDLVIALCLGILSYLFLQAKLV